MLCLPYHPSFSTAVCVSALPLGFVTATCLLPSCSLDCASCLPLCVRALPQFVALPDGRLPDGDKDAKHVRDIFYRCVCVCVHSALPSRPPPPFPNRAA